MTVSVGAVVSSKKIILVEGHVEVDGTITLIKDETMNLETGDRPAALRQMHKRVKDRLSEGVDKVAVKASSGGRFAAKTGVLHAAELRGVFLSAIPNQVEILETHAKSVSKGKSQKIGDYLNDDDYFSKNFTGVELRKGSREAALLMFEVEGKQ
ncbi:hypothetical protein [Shimia thalassica]|uniref:hypothetical protein n=1 Tax=Shimia thalassica TaxID=1715693 RepID=UPI002734189D|nr:hypothetical protein [Shimia thalassica]MDP2520905.1 hypothetical protein [Shimia thalassica]